LKILYNNGSTRIWRANLNDYNFILYLCKKFRDKEFFYVPDNSLKNEIVKGNIYAFDYNILEAGYIWVTFPKNGRSRVNQLAVDPELWRNKVGTIVTKFYEGLSDSYGMWSVYLSCNSNTPGHKFWPKVGWTEVCTKPAGRRGGVNIIWGKLLPRANDFIFPIDITYIKNVESYRLQSSISKGVKKNKIVNTQYELF